MRDWVQRLKSRKFWLGVASFLASVSSMIVGFNIDNDFLIYTSLFAAVLSAAIYETIETICDVCCNKTDDSTNDENNVIFEESESCTDDGDQSVENNKIGGSE